LAASGRLGPSVGHIRPEKCSCGVDPLRGSPAQAMAGQSSPEVPLTFERGRITLGNFAEARALQKYVNVSLQYLPISPEKASQPGPLYMLTCGHAWRVKYNPRVGFVSSCRTAPAARFRTYALAAARGSALDRLPLSWLRAPLRVCARPPAGAEGARSTKTLMPEATGALRTQRTYASVRKQRGY
jgi:hypothetical protein